LKTNVGRRRHKIGIAYFGEETAGTNATDPKKVSWVRVTVKTNVLMFRDYILRYSAIGPHVGWSRM
jgi:hypothetical protein